MCVLKWPGTPDKHLNCAEKVWKSLCIFIRTIPLFRIPEKSNMASNFAKMAACVARQNVNVGYHFEFLGNYEKGNLEEKSQNSQNLQMPRIKIRDHNR